MFKVLQRTRQPSLVRVIKPKYTLFKPIHASNFITRRPVTHATLETASTATAVTPTPIVSGATNESAKLKSTIVKFLYENKQRPIPSSEKNVIITNCPHCLNVRKNSFAAHVNLQKGAYQCKTCHSKGSFPEFSAALVKKLQKIRGDDSFTLVPAGNMLSGTSKGQCLSRSAQEIDDYSKALLNDTHLLDYLQQQHALKKETLSAFGVGATEINNQLCLTFPQTALNYTNDEFTMDTVSLKSCDVNDLDHLVEMDPPSANKDTKAVGLFGYQTTTAHDDTVILTRREMDAMAAYQATGIPSIALPNANYQLQEAVLPMLERFSRVYVWMDDDVDGRIAAERFARKIGEYRCMLINSREGNLQGPLNAHDALVEKKDLKQIVAKASGIKHDQIVDFVDLREEVYNEILHPEQTRGIQSKDLPALNQIIKGHRSGELTILTGPTGAGKTTIISQLSLDYCKSGVPTLWGSFEIMNKRLAKKMLYQFAEEDLSLHPEKFEQIADQFQQLPLYFLKFFSSTAIKDVLKACHHAVYAYDVRHIVLDNLQFMLSQQAGNSLDKWDLQDNAIAEIRKFATQQDVHITLVVHPRKDNGTNEELDIHSIFGSAKVTQEADNVVILQKSRTNSRSLDIKKNRFDGTLGTVPYIFDKLTSKIRQCTKEEMLKMKKEQFKHAATTSYIRR